METYRKTGANTLGIVVTTDKHLEYIVALANAAYEKKKDVQIFFTGDAVMIAQNEKFSQLAEKIKLSVCYASFRDLGLKCEVPWIGSEAFETQSRIAEMMETCDRYVVL